MHIHFPMEFVELFIGRPQAVTVSIGILGEPGAIPTTPRGTAPHIRNPSSVTAYRAIRTFAVIACAGGGVNIVRAVISALSGRIGAGQVAEQVTEIRLSPAGRQGRGLTEDQAVRGRGLSGIQAQSR
jgi:hypothetical protein